MPRSVVGGGHASAATPAAADPAIAALAALLTDSHLASAPRPNRPLAALAILARSLGSLISSLRDAHASTGHATRDAAVTSGAERRGGDSPALAPAQPPAPPQTEDLGQLTLRASLERPGSSPDDAAGPRSDPASANDDGRTPPSSWLAVIGPLRGRSGSSAHGGDDPLEPVRDLLDRLGVRRLHLVALMALAPLAATIMLVAVDHILGGG